MMGGKLKLKCIWTMDYCGNCHLLAVKAMPLLPKWKKFRGLLQWSAMDTDDEWPLVQTRLILEKVVDLHIGAVTAVNLEEAVWQFERLAEQPYEKPIANSLVTCMVATARWRWLFTSSPCPSLRSLIQSHQCSHN